MYKRDFFAPLQWFSLSNKSLSGAEEVKFEEYLFTYREHINEKYHQRWL